MGAAKTPPGPLTERVVLRRLNTAGEKAPERWEVLGTVKATSKAAAIKALAKDEPGQYRAPSLRSWKGGLEIVVPAKPKAEVRAFDG